MAGGVIRFLAPEWFFFLAVALFVGWYFRRLELWRPLRATIVLLATLILVQPELRRYKDGLDLWVLFDRSASASEFVAPRLGEWETLLRNTKGKDDRLYVVDYAAEPQVRAGGETLVLEGRDDATRTANAIRYAALQRDPDKAAKVLVFTDGFATDDLAESEGLLLENEIPLDFRLVGGSVEADIRVATLRLPQRVQVTEPFVIDVLISGIGTGSVPFALRRDDTEIQSGDVTLENGLARLRFTDRVGRAGAFSYSFEINPAGDSIRGNNAKNQWIEIEAGPRILLITSFDPDPTAEVLRQLGFAVETVSTYEELTPGRLSGARAVIINDVPASEFPADFLPSLDFFVRAQGGGLAMVGGRYSFGSGGYFNSPIDSILPVSMELRQEHRKLAVAMAIVMDRSGSMGAPVPGTGLTKMAMANSGATATVELLGESDAVTVIVVDSAAHPVVPLTQVGGSRREIQDRTSKIVSMGGGIYVYTGLKAAWDELQKSDAGQKHVILFSDAADSEEPGSYVKLLEEMEVAKTTVSVIALGSPTDPDAAFLEDIAKRGSGRIFFNTDPSNLPAIFTQETVAVARSAFIEEVVGVQETAGWLEIAAKPIDWLGRVDAYNLSYLREGATSAAFTMDEYRAPLVAYWQRGAGRTAAITFPLAGDYAMIARRWRDYGDFIQTLSRWLVGEDIPAGIGYRTRVVGDRLDVDLFYDDSWQDTFTAGFPDIVVSDGGMDDARTLTWKRVKPGHLTASNRLDTEKPMRGAIRVGKTVLPFGPFSLGSDEEWQLDAAKRQELIQLAVRTGGREVVDLEDAWTSEATRRFTDMRPALTLLLLVLFLAEALLTRLNISLVPRSVQRTLSDVRPT